MDEADTLFNFVRQFCPVKASRQEAASIAGDIPDPRDSPNIQGGP